MASSKGKWYVVFEGRNPGVYQTWEDCYEQVEGYPKARYRSFSNQADAVAAYRADLTGDMALLRSIASGERSFVNYAAIPEVNVESIAVDAACSGNPGKMEYRGVWLRTGEQIFHQGPFPQGTNNIGEFLAIVHALALLKQKGLPSMTIYSDSKIAIGWVKKGVCRTKLTPNPKNAELLSIVRRAELWLQNNTYANPIVKWNTDEWGEIPADFGRK